MLAQMAKGQFKKKAQAAEEPASDNGERPGFELQCDVNGCTIVPVSQMDAARSPAGTPALPICDQLISWPVTQTCPALKRRSTLSCQVNLTHTVFKRRSSLTAPHVRLQAALWAPVATATAKQLDRALVTLCWPKATGGKLAMTGAQQIPRVTVLSLPLTPGPWR